MEKDKEVNLLLSKENQGRKQINKNLVTETIDNETGEVTKETFQSEFMVTKEPDYVKVYLNTLCVFNGLSQSVSPVLFEFCKYMTWADNQQILSVNKYMKDEIALATNLTINSVNKTLKRIVDSGIFIKLDGYRGTYKVNPYFIAKGDWSSVKELRGEFDFIEGKFVIKAIEEEKENN